MSWEMSKMFMSKPLVRIAAILVKYGWLLYKMRDDAQVFALMQRLLIHLGLNQQTVDRRWFEVYELTAWNLLNYGKIKEAVLMLEQVVKIQEQTLAKDHPDRLASQHALAGAYKANGQVKEAVSLLEQVVKIEEQTLAEDHPDRLVSQGVLARMYWRIGRRNAGLQMMKHVVEKQRQALDGTHPLRIGSEAWLKKFEREVGNTEPL
jgi:tetratricopeptide (TPR) repeat protein